MLKSMWIFVFVFVQYCIAQKPVMEMPINYTGHSAIDLGLLSEKDLRFFDRLNTENGEIRIVHESNGTIAVISPTKLNEFKRTLNNRRIKFNIVSNNIQEEIDAEELEKPSIATARQSIFGWDNYYNYDDMVDWMRMLQTGFPDSVKLVTAGSTYEGRTIFGIRISTQSGLSQIILEGGIHGREWISPATVTYVAGIILTSTDAAIRTLFRSFEWHIFPVVNPDGYQFSRTSDRLWRKNRHMFQHCIGVDLNRNFEMEFRADNTVCSETYSGPQAFSELETKGFSNYVMTLTRAKVYLAFHSYSQYLMFPYGYTSGQSPFYSKHSEMATMAVAALKSRYGTVYEVGSIHKKMSRNGENFNGLSIDWAFQKQKITYSFVYELSPGPDQKSMGFVLPPKMILPTVKEATDSILVIIREALKK